MTNILSVTVVVGTRPEAIKMAPLMVALSTDERFSATICTSGQHREMLEQVLNLFNIKPDYNLDVMRPDQSPSEVAARILSGLQDVFTQKKPDVLLVHGDTITASAAAFAGYLNGIPVGHVEAGLRTGDLYEPWPEEGNRRVIGSLARYHFAPTQVAQNNLLKENIAPETILVTGNTVIDALIATRDKINGSPEIAAEMVKTFSFLNPQKRTILVTIHRRESFGAGLERVCEALIALIKTHSDIEIVLPVHPNPNVSKYVRKTLSNRTSIHLIDPLEYLPFVYLMEQSFVIMTDSGGIQEEAPSLGKPVLVLRNTTERPEAVDAGTVRLVGTDKDLILEEMGMLLNDDHFYKTMAQAHNPYGDGRAVPRILDFLGCIEK